MDKSLKYFDYLYSSRVNLTEELMFVTLKFYILKINTVANNGSYYIQFFKLNFK